MIIIIMKTSSNNASVLGVCEMVTTSPRRPSQYLPGRSCKAQVMVLGQPCVRNKIDQLPGPTVRRDEVGYEGQSDRFMFGI